MYDFGLFCYLDVQKTGSTFVGNLLKACSKSPMIFYSKHSPARDLDREMTLRLLRNLRLKRLWTRAGFFREDVIYFNSIRNPFGFYSSLYNYGCDGNGAVYKKFRKAGLDQLYDGTQDGFLNWVKVILEPKNAGLLEGDYHLCSDAVGFMTYRFLRLSLHDPVLHLGELTDRSVVRNVFDAKNICRMTLRQEKLKDDVLELAGTHLSEHLDHAKVHAFLDAGRINASKSKAGHASVIEQSAIGDLVRERDFLIFDLFYPEK